MLRDGKLQQVDSPQALFAAPVNLFVAGFIGSPAMNFTMARLVRDDGPAVTFAGHKLPVPAALLAERPALDSYFGRDLILGIRPTDFEDADLADPDWAPMPVHADVTEALGSEMHVIFGIDAPPPQAASLAQATSGDGDDPAITFASGKTQWTARVAARSAVRTGQPVRLAIDTRNLQFFDPATELAIRNA